MVSKIATRIQFTTQFLDTNTLQKPGFHALNNSLDAKFALTKSNVRQSRLHLLTNTQILSPIADLNLANRLKMTGLISKAHN